MIVAFWALFSWIYWGLWIAAFVGYEAFAVKYEKRNGALPLTRVVRDRLMRKFLVVKLGVLLLIGWLALHFLLPLDW